jgi:hypothetical protein
LWGGCYRRGVCDRVQTGRGEVDRKISKAVPWRNLANHRTLQTYYITIRIDDCIQRQAPPRTQDLIHYWRRESRLSASHDHHACPPEAHHDHVCAANKCTSYSLTKRSCPAIRHAVSLGYRLGSVSYRAPLTRRSMTSAFRHWHTLCLSPSFHQACLPSHAARLSAMAYRLVERGRLRR